MMVVVIIRMMTMNRDNEEQQVSRALAGSMGEQSWVLKR
jgi:hypothetical protein